MTDVRLDALRRDPSSEFATRLRAELDRQEAAAAPRRGWSPRHFAAPGMAVVVAAMLFAVPGVRAAAASFLARFRVVNFVAVPVDPTRLDVLGTERLDLGKLIGEHVEVLQASAPVTVASIDAAAALAGFDVRLPAWQPEGAQIVEIQVMGERSVRITGDASRLRDVLDALSIRDLEVPGSLDGQTATVHVPPVVMVRFEHGGRHTRLFQSHSPEVRLPEGIDIAALGEIALRILGLPSEEARQFAGSIDWTNTMIVPIPPTARAFREVEVSGEPGVWVAYQAPNESSTNMVLWSHGDRVFGLVSIQAVDQVFAMANSIP